MKLAKNYIYCVVKRVSEDILLFSICFHGAETKHLNGRGFGCSTCRTLKPSYT
jgi:hypothetical protein